jgi:hypothetical protein
MQAKNNATSPVPPQVVISMLLVGLSLGGLLVLAISALAALPGNGLWAGLSSVEVDSKLPWYLVRASGTVAYLLLTASTVWGLVLSAKVAKEVSLAPYSLAMHNALSWTAIGLAGLHAWMLLLDSYYVYLPADLLVPFIGPYRPGWVGLGTLSLYLLIVISASFAWKKLITHKGWRALHYLSFPVFVFVTLHGLKAGTDSPEVSMQVMYGGSSLLVLYLTTTRVLAAIRHKRARKNTPSRPAATLPR